jgi:hypothetical protein
MSDDGRQLELMELQRRFEDTIALDGLTFTVPRGEVRLPRDERRRTAAAAWRETSG